MLKYSTFVINNRKQLVKNQNRKTNELNNSTTTTTTTYLLTWIIPLLYWKWYFFGENRFNYVRMRSQKTLLQMLKGNSGRL